MTDHFFLKFFKVKLVMKETKHKTLFILTFLHAAVMIPEL